MITLDNIAILKGAVNGSFDKFEPTALVCNVGTRDIPSPDSMFFSNRVEDPVDLSSLKSNSNHIHVDAIEVWDAKKERLFSRLAELEALNKLRPKESAELERLTRMRRHLKNPRSGEEVLWEYEQRMLTRSLVQALTNYVKFHAAESRSR